MIWKVLDLASFPKNGDPVVVIREILNQYLSLGVMRNSSIYSFT